MSFLEKLRATEPADIKAYTYSSLDVRFTTQEANYIEAMSAACANRHAKYDAQLRAWVTPEFIVETPASVLKSSPEWPEKVRLEPTEIRVLEPDTLIQGYGTALNDYLRVLWSLLTDDILAHLSGASGRINVMIAYCFVSVSKIEFCLILSVDRVRYAITIRSTDELYCHTVRSNVEVGNFYSHHKPVPNKE